MLDTIRLRFAQAVIVRLKARVAELEQLLSNTACDNDLLISMQRNVELERTNLLLHTELAQVYAKLHLKENRNVR